MKWLPKAKWYLEEKKMHSFFFVLFPSDENGQERFLHQGRCRMHCPRGLYPDRGRYACLPCIANCELCTDGNICAKCRERYKLHGGLCQTAHCDIGKQDTKSFVVDKAYW